MDINVSKYERKDKVEWDDFVKSSNNGTLFHLIDFLEYHGDKYKTNEHNLIFRKRGNIISVLPAAILNIESTRVLCSPYGASYGGFVIPEKFTLEDLFATVKSFLEYAKENDIDEVELTLTPLIYFKLPHDYINFVLLKHGFEYTRGEITSVVKVTTEPFNVFKMDARKSTRKSREFGVEVFESENFEMFYEILLENKKVRHDTVPTHTLKELLWLKKRLPEKFKLFLAFLNGKPIAGVLLFICNDIAPLTFYIVHHPDFQKYRSTNLLIYEIIKWTSSAGYKYLDLGTSTMNMEPNWGLIRFKESVGCVGYFRNTFKLFKCSVNNII